MDTGHPEDETLTAAAAVAHYDNTGTQAMYVAAGEDQYGIWVAGCVAPDMDEEKIMKARAAKLSGDWRAVRGNLEMVAVLAVNTGGFLVPRSYETSEGVLALVAAGVVPRGVELTTPSTEITDAVQAELDRREAAKQAKEALAAVQARAKGREQERLKGELSKIKSRRSS